MSVSVRLADVFELNCLLILKSFIRIVLPWSEVTHCVHYALLVILLKNNLVGFVVLCLPCLLLLRGLAHLREAVSGCFGMVGVRGCLDRHKSNLVVMALVFRHSLCRFFGLISTVWPLIILSHHILDFHDVRDLAAHWNLRCASRISGLVGLTICE